MAMSVHQIHAMKLMVLAMPGTTETNNAIMQYTKSLTPSPPVVMIPLLVERKFQIKLMSYLGGLR